MDEKGGWSKVDGRALDVDDIPLAADFDVHSTPAHPLQMCCPSPPPYPSQSMAFKFDSVAAKKEIRHSDRECRQGWRNHTKEERMRNRMEEMKYVLTECPLTACISGKLTCLVVSFHVAHPNTKRSSQEKTDATRRPPKKRPA